MAHLAGLKVAAVVDQAKHGRWLSEPSATRPDMLLDNHDPRRAIDILQRTLGHQLRYGIDTKGKVTSAHLLSCLQGTQKVQRSSPSPPSTPCQYERRRAHLVGFSGLPHVNTHEDVIVHAVPIKLFHEVPAIGMALCLWMERLLSAHLLHPPRVIGQHFGLGDVNNALDRMRVGDVSGGKLVVTV